MSKLRVAVIGSGMIANVAHIPGYLRLPEMYEIAAVSDLLEDVAKHTSEMHKIPQYFKDPQKMLDEVKPDIVSICTPNMYHKEWTIKALNSGANVICEKPIAMKLSDAKEMYATAEKNNKFFTVVQTMRFGQDVVKKYLDQKVLGEIYAIHVESVRRRGVPNWGMFHMKEHNGGGPFCDMGVHLLDQIIWLLGNPKITTVSGSAYAKIANQEEDVAVFPTDNGAPGGLFTPRTYDYRENNVEDSSFAFIRLENGITITMRVTWAINLPPNNFVSYAGTKGGLITNPFKIYTNIDGYQTEYTPQTKPVRPVKTEGEGIPFYSHTKLFRHVYDVMFNGAELFIKKEEVLNVMAGIEAFYESARTGQEVRIK